MTKTGSDGEVARGWRPHPRIRVIAIGLHWRQGRLLAAEVRDDAGRLKGVRPQGGGVEFGEPCEAALRREFREELGIQIVITGGPAVLENIFSHEGATGHEVVFAFDVELPAEVLEAERIDFREDDGMPVVARWYALDELDVGGGPALYPSGLKAMLIGRSGGGA